jgi:hypothetical protein
VVVLLQQQQKGTTEGTEGTEGTEARHEEHGGKQHPGVAVQGALGRDPECACAAEGSPPILGESTDSPAVAGFAPIANPRTGSARVP